VKVEMGRHLRSPHLAYGQLVKKLRVVTLQLERLNSDKMTSHFYRSRECEFYELKKSNSRTFTNFKSLVNFIVLFFQFVTIFYFFYKV